VKLELRKRLRGLRKALPASSCAERSARIVERLLALEPVARAQTVALFWPMIERREVDLRTLDANLRVRGVRIAYPSITFRPGSGEAGEMPSDPATQAMTFRFVGDPGSMVETVGGLVEPRPEDPAAGGTELDVIVVPALAVDPRGHRIGYGAGFYDRTLPLFSPPAATVAVAFDFQLLAEVPATEGDVPVEWVVTDTRVLRSAEAGG
jgi:5-formyltetrahydrofolate cyclo-ligase